MKYIKRVVAVIEHSLIIPPPDNTSNIENRIKISEVEITTAIVMIENGSDHTKPSMIYNIKRGND